MHIFANIKLTLLEVDGFDVNRQINNCSSLGVQGHHYIVDTSRKSGKVLTEIQNVCMY